MATFRVPGPAEFADDLDDRIRLAGAAQVPIAMATAARELSPSARGESAGSMLGRAPRNEGRRYPADPPTVEEIIAVMRAAGGAMDGARLRTLT